MYMCVVQTKHSHCECHTVQGAVQVPKWWETLDWVDTLSLLWSAQGEVVPLLGGTAQKKSVDPQMPFLNSPTITYFVRWLSEHSSKAVSKPYLVAPVETTNWRGHGGRDNHTSRVLPALKQERTNSFNIHIILAVYLYYSIIIYAHTSTIPILHIHTLVLYLYYTYTH